MSGLALALGLLVGCGEGQAPTPQQTASAAAEASAPVLFDPSQLAELSASALPSATAGPESEAMASGSAAVSAPPLSGATLARTPVTHDFSKGPLFFSPAYDGSLRYSLWTKTMSLSRRLGAQHNKSVHFTFFINSVYYSTESGPSDISRALSHNEILVRRALTQQAINEGHEIGNHGAGHLDGRAYSRAEWEAEFDRFHKTMDGTLFVPMRDKTGQFLFPQWQALSEALPQQAGSSCSKAEECESGLCIELTQSLSVCSQACNSKQRCPEQMACGAPSFKQDTDLCLPLPKLPIVVLGKTWFDKRGIANPKIKELSPYRFIGFRAPYLSENVALYETLAARGYRYDTSLVRAPPEVPTRLSAGGKKPLYSFPLMPHNGALSIPMDYNYRLEKGSAERMEADYRAALVSSYASGRRPWNVGHHFASWGEATYLRVLERTVEFSLTGCPGEDGSKQCDNAEVVSFRDLTAVLDGAGAIK